MLGIVYIIISIIAGYFIVRKFLPDIAEANRLVCLNGKQPELSKPMVLLPASFLTGTLILTWITYIAAYIFRNSKNPMLYGNLALFGFILVVALVCLIRSFVRSKRNLPEEKKYSLSQLASFFSFSRLEILFILFVAAIFSYLIFRSFHIKDTTIFTGFSVYSDFGPHLAMIRSFSAGSNFPTEYPHFADGTVRYHFFFQFLAGNLEFLGLRLDWAFNLPSILSMVSFLMLLYSYAVILFEKKWIGFISAIFFVFRSSFAIFIYIADKLSIGKAVSDLLASDTHIGETPYEEWGLWAQKTFINQRHLPFGLGILLMLLIIFHPLFKKMVDSLLENTTLSVKLKEFILVKNAWLPEKIIQPVLAGIILGLCTFWNGATVIATLAVLFILALFSKRRLEFLITAVIAVILSLAESRFFFGQGHSAISPKFTWGFIASETSVTGVIAYYLQLLGFMPFVIAAACVIAPKGTKRLLFAFSTPLILATTLQLTPDVVVNHKYVFVTIILFNMVAALFVYRLTRCKPFIAKITAAVIIAGMTLTGVADMIVLHNIDKHAVTADLNDPTMLWVENNTLPNEIFLTDNYVTHPILLAGRKLFNGWQYFAWSAGYQTVEREKTVKQIYGAATAEELKILIESNHISYIVVDDQNRNSKDYTLNEALIRETYPMAYSNENNNMIIYKTK